MLPDDIKPRGLASAPNLLEVHPVGLEIGQERSETNPMLTSLYYMFTVIIRY